jgi:hypothetical protein
VAAFTFMSTSIRQRTVGWYQQHDCNRVRLGLAVQSTC